MSSVLKQTHYTDEEYLTLERGRNVVNGYDCSIREQRSGEAYTENYVGHRGFAHP
jgi:hypothetical protein